jgi:hypothetical protein
VEFRVPYFTQYHLQESGREEWVFFSAFIDYRLADGTKLPIEQDPAWCPHCRRFVCAERVESIESLEEEKARYECRDAELLKIWAFVSNGAPVEDRITQLVRRIEWRRGRISPPRCLHCGEVGVISIPITGEFLHPVTGEKVTTGESGFGDTLPWEAEFSPEGQILAQFVNSTTQP